MKPTPLFFLSNDIGVKWNEEQIALINALNTHNEIIFQSPRQRGRTYALCGLIATLMREYEGDVVFKILLYATSKREQLNKLKYIKEMYGSDRFVMQGNSMLTPTVTVTILNSDKQRAQFIKDLKLILVDDADVIAPKIFFNDVIPLAQIYSSKVMFLHTNDVDYLTHLKELRNSEGNVYYHSIKTF